jgi:MoxR-like ATPase
MGQKSTGGTTTVGHQQASDVRPWRLVEAAAPYTRRVLLYGPPGTGKSYLARTAGVLDPDMVYPVPIHEDIPAAELRGHFIAQENGGFAWADGPAIMAWRNGGRLVLDEIDKAGSDGLSFLLAILDDFKTAKTTLATTGEVISPHEDFTIWATMNGELDDLPPALRDRFPVSVRITAPHPQAIAALPHDLQALAAQLSVAEPKRRVGLRRFYEFANLRQHMALLDAGELIFGVDRWPEIAQAIDLARATDVR